MNNMPWNTRKSKSKKKEVGVRVITTKNHESLSTKINSGTEVIVTYIDPIRGYDIRTDEGARVAEIGWII